VLVPEQRGEAGDEGTPAYAEFDALPAMTVVRGADDPLAGL